jgi:DNA invertase Pin-like site-specific DNA recombinase
MKHGYIRLTKRGATEDRQRDALMAAGVAPERIHVDDQRKGKPGKPAPLRNRPGAVLCIREGDVLVVATPGRLGVSAADIESVIAEVTALGGEVQAAGGEPFGGPAVAALTAFRAAAHLEVERERLVPARKARGAQPKRINDKQMATLLPLWRDPNNHTTAAVELKAEEIGVKMSRRTMYKLLGNRVQQ